MITKEAFELLQKTQRTLSARLVQIELPQSTSQNPQYMYYTDFYRNLEYLGKTYRSHSFKGLGVIRHTRELSAHKTSLTFTGLDDVQLSHALEDKASFINKKVTAHLLLLDASTEEPIQLTEDTAGMRLLDGQITNVKISDSAKNTTITWEVSNHFHNFNEVNGRLTADHDHRGVIVDAGQFVASAATKRPEYVDDRGFEYANQTVDVLAQYQTKETRYKLNSSRKGGLGGLMGGRNFSLEEYEVVVTKQTDLRFSLASKYLPVAYGVQQNTGVPIFADTDVNDPSQVYVVYAFAEGEIEGFLDLTLDDKSIICYDDTDDEARVCFGRKRVVGNTISMATPNPSDTTAPSTHGQEYIYDDGAGEVKFWTYHGKPNQTASSVLKDLAAQGRFYLQGELGRGADYWSDNHKLLDTAYIVMKFKLSDLNGGRTSIPEVKAEILGKKIKTYTTGGVGEANQTNILPAWQILDYLTSKLYGAKVPLDEIDLDSFIRVANIQSIIDTSYSSSWTPFWRYLGWRSPTDSQRYVMQMNTLIPTEESVFSNVEELLSQSRCALNKIDGKYVLTVESLESNPIKINLDEEALGNKDYQDLTGSKKYNTVNANIRDPALAWKSNPITMYNSTFKIEDRGLEKRLNLNFPYITNYYTARNLADRELKKSRFSGQLKITLPFYYIYRLMPNTNTLITYSRYSWKDELFLVDAVELLANGNISVTLERYAPSVFLNSEQADNSEGQVSVTDSVLPVRNLQYTPTAKGGPIGLNGILSWEPSRTAAVAFYTVVWTGQVDAKVVESRNSIDRVEFPVMSLEGGQYTFQVRAVDTSGRYSKPIQIVVDVDSAMNLPTVSNFRVVNLEPGFSTRFVGPDVLLEWDALDLAQFPVEGLYYDLDVLKEGIVIRDVQISGTTNYSYTLQENINDFAINNSDQYGFNRDLSFRIKAKGSKGEESVSWAVIR